MRRARITYPGAFHHVMNRGHDGLPVFKTAEDKRILLDLMQKNKEKCKISILAFCVMDNHYHFLIQNNSGRMSDFLKRVNGEYGSIYRKRNGGRGYVFQSRFKSILIEKEQYLLLALAYVLNNPVVANLVKDFLDYRWSSGSYYFKSDQNSLVDNSFVINSFNNVKVFKSFVNKNMIDSLPLTKSKIGFILGSKEFLEESFVLFNRRKIDDNLETKRKDDIYFEPVEKIFHEFKNRHKIDPSEIDLSTFNGKKLRGELLVNLKDLSGLTYREISSFDVFSSVKFNSLGRIYKYTKERLGNK